MNVPFFNLSRQYASLKQELEPVALEVLASGSYIGGTYVRHFEQEMAEYLGVKHALACGNGTDALVLALRACGVQPGDEVITTPFTFFATAEAISVIGGVPVFVDILPGDFNIDPALIEEKITAKTRVILPVHLFGAPCDMAAILEIARRHGLKVVEDAAQAIGCQLGGKHIGATADLSCFSFYPTKNLGGMGDGGMVTTADDDLATIVLALREHGAALTGVKARALLYHQEQAFQTLPQTTTDYDPYKYLNSLVGHNSRLDAIQAALLSVKLKHLPEYGAARGRIAAQYTQQLDQAVNTPCARADGTHCWHQYVIRSEHKQALCTYLNEHGVGAGTFYPIPLHLQKAFEALGYTSGMLPQAEAAARETVCLPIFPEMTEEEVLYVVQQVNAFVGQAH